MCQGSQLAIIKVWMNSSRITMVLLHELFEVLPDCLELFGYFGFTHVSVQTDLREVPIEIFRVLRPGNLHNDLWLDGSLFLGFHSLFFFFITSTGGTPSLLGLGGCFLLGLIFVGCVGIGVFEDCCANSRILISRCSMSSRLRFFFMVQQFDSMSFPPESNAATTLVGAMVCSSMLRVLR